MEHDVPGHEKVWFRREHISRLDSLPSATAPALRVGKGRTGRLRRRRRLLRFALRTIAATLFVVVALAVGVYVAGISGVGGERLRAEAEALMTALAGQEIDAEFGPAGISLDASRFIALQMKGLKLAAGDDGAEIVEAGLVRFGVRFLPLLSGELKIGSARIADARIVPSSVSFRRETHWSDGLRNADGLIDPDRLLRSVFRSIHRGFDALDLRATQSIELDNVEIVLDPSAPARNVTIVSATIERSGAGEMLLEAEISADGRILQVTAGANRATGERRIQDFVLEARSDFPAAPGEESGGAAVLSLAGAEGAGDLGDRLTVRLDADRLAIDLGEGGRLTGDLDFEGLLAERAGKLEIATVDFRTGRSSFVFHGAVGPAPREAGDTRPPAYRYELVSDGSVAAPMNSPEPALDFLARIAGRFDPAARRLTADEIGIRTGPGEVVGSASVTFGASGSPGIALALSVPAMPVGQVKQLWPWFAARGARSWVANNVYGGMVSDSMLRLDLAQGRLGNGKPLTGSEVFGRFAIDGARFDVAGRMPPVRHAVGLVSFAGSDVDIEIASGTVYLPNGKTVEAKDGTFRIGAANADPQIGALDIHVAGEASAVTQLASYEPINALRQLDLRPQDFSGRIEGRVKADIPLRRDIPVSRLAWLVEMTYEDLAVAKPFEGQLVTEANGAIRIEPSKVVIEGAARLNGVPATLDIVEPLGGSATERRRDIALELDDAARNRLLPGLASMLSGPVTVKVTRGEELGEQDVTADLTRATLTLPWAGWSKGPGVGADVSFAMTIDEQNIALDDFMLAGKTFGATGTVALSDGSLSRARFSSVRLNRNDAASLDISRSGKGYAVSIRGSSFDARSLIKHYLGAGKPGASSAEAVPVTLEADFESLSGFSGEILNDVTLAYRGSGSRVDALTIEAAARSGGAVTVANADSGGKRTVSMKSTDAGAILRFLDIYEHMEGGRIDLALSSSGAGPLRGKIDARDFWIVNEPKLRSLVASAPDAEGRIDVSRAQFERGFTLVEKGVGYLAIARGVLRGPQIGATFQGTLYDANDEMAITGTFMPAYGLNRLFGELPLIGQILGNGRDRGLIGITFKLAGDVKAPKLQVNPLSAIAPGIFRSIFEFN